MEILAAIFMFVYATVMLPSSASEPPDCSRVDDWATLIAFVYMKNAGIINNYSIDWNKTKTVRLASEEVGVGIRGYRGYKGLDEEEYAHRQVHLVKYTEKSGNVIEMIVVNEASNIECSVDGDVEILIISQRVGNKRLGFDDP